MSLCLKFSDGVVPVQKLGTALLYLLSPALQLFAVPSRRLNLIGGGREVCPEELHGHELLLQTHPAQWKVHRHQPDARSRHQDNLRADPVKRSTMTNAGGAVTSDQFHPLSHPASALPSQRQDPMPPTSSPTYERLRDYIARRMR
jgi:hypothetical protein